MHSNSSKQALTNDLIEGLEKDLERLKRFEENLRIRKLRTMKGGDKIINETEEDRKNIREDTLKADVTKKGAHIIHADEQRLQLMRHQAGQLESLKNLDLDALEEQRLANKRKIDELTEVYLRKIENKAAGKMIRRKLGFNKRSLSRTPEKDERSEGSALGSLRKRSRPGDEEFERGTNLSEDDEAVPLGSARGRRKKSIRFNDDPEEGGRG